MRRNMPGLLFVLRTPMGRLRMFSRIEGTTFLVLVGIGVPLKYFADDAFLVGLMGPVHGAAFVAYMMALAEATAAGGWRAREVVRTAILSILPFGPFLNDRFLAAKGREIEAEQQA